MYNPFDEAYHGLCEEILEIGNRRDDRTHTGTISKFGHQLRFDLTKGFPLLKEIQTFNTYLNIITIYGMNGHLKIMFSLMIIMDQT